MEPTIVNTPNKSWIPWTVAIIAIAVIVIVFVVVKKPASAPTTDTNMNTPADTTPSQNTAPANGSSGSNAGSSVNVNVNLPPVEKHFTITGSNYKFSPSSITVNQGDRVTITLDNSGGMHDLKIEGYNVGTKAISTDQSESFTFTADKTGTFEFYCSVGSHRAMGMKGVLVVK